MNKQNSAQIAKAQGGYDSSGFNYKTNFSAGQRKGFVVSNNTTILGIKLAVFTAICGKCGKNIGRDAVIFNRGNCESCSLKLKTVSIKPQSENIRTSGKIVRLRHSCTCTVQHRKNGVGEWI